MSKPRLLILPLLFSLAGAVQAQRLPGCVCFEKAQSFQATLRSDNVPVQFQRASDDDVRNLAHIDVASMKAPAEFRMQNLTRAEENGVRNTVVLDGQLYRILNSGTCGCMAPKQKITIPDSVMRKLHEETMQNAKKNAEKSTPE